MGVKSFYFYTTQWYDDKYKMTGVHKGSVRCFVPARSRRHGRYKEDKLGERQLRLRENLIPDTLIT